MSESFRALTDGSRTPPFLLWALEYQCSLRQIDGWREPERTERHLRSVREFGEGLLQGRVLDGVCLGPECLTTTVPKDEPTGFVVADALEIFGGEGLVRETCGRCPANVGGSVRGASLAGCFGLLPLPGDLPTDWFTYWLEPLAGDAARDVLSKITAERIGRSAAPAGDAFDQLLAALATAAEHRLPLHARMFPAGRIAQRRWVVAAHCPRCGGERDCSAATCALCGANSPAVAEKRRHLRGRRPYWSLSRVVGAESAAELLARIASRTA